MKRIWMFSLAAVTVTAGRRSDSREGTGSSCRIGGVARGPDM
jgi:hypothetical protein